MRVLVSIGVNGQLMDYADLYVPGDQRYPEAHGVGNVM